MQDLVRNHYGERSLLVEALVCARSALVSLFSIRTELDFLLCARTELGFLLCARTELVFCGERNTFVDALVCARNGLVSLLYARTGLVFCATLLNGRNMLGRLSRSVGWDNNLLNHGTLVLVTLLNINNLDRLGCVSVAMLRNWGSIT